MPSTVTANLKVASHHHSSGCTLRLVSQAAELQSIRQAWIRDPFSLEAVTEFARHSHSLAGWPMPMHFYLLVS